MITGVYALNRKNMLNKTSLHISNMRYRACNPKLKLIYASPKHDNIYKLSLIMYARITKLLNINILTYSKAQI